jgi:pSer/pThr/pTyr-binding forkhead associated (FHA) protein
VITPNESITFVPRHEASDDPVKVPLLLIVGNSQGAVPTGADRLATFTGSLIIGRKEMTQVEPGQSSLILSDRMVSSQHLAITRAPEEGVFELTDLSSTNGTIVDGEPVETSVRLRDGSVIFVGSYVVVFRIATITELAAIQSELQKPLGPVPTASPAFATICRKLRKLAEAGEEMLLTGETGSGKEVYANAIHRASGRPGRFVAINCAAIPRELVETELFGYARGAHSQAAMAKQGIIEQAEGGTLFLDEIGEMAPELQTKLLRFTQDRLLAPVGGLRPRRIETRIIAATSRTAAPSQSRRCGSGSRIWARFRATCWGSGTSRSSCRPSRCSAFTLGQGTCASSAKWSCRRRRSRATQRKSRSSTCRSPSWRRRRFDRRPGDESLGRRPAPPIWRR